MGALVQCSVCLAGAPLLRAQALPAGSARPVTGFELPSASGTLTYSFTLSDSVSLGYNGNNQTTNSANISGNLGYLSHSVHQPFSAVYTGGYLAGSNGQPSSLVQVLSLSQVLAFKRFNIVLSDSINYLPSNPVSGLSGVPGLGDLGLPPVPDGANTSLLSNYGARLTNSAAVSGSYSLTARTYLSAAGNQTILRLPGGSGATGIESNTEGGSASVSHRVNARNTLSANAIFNHFSYLSSPLKFDSEAATVELTRQWNAHLTTDLSAGPQITSTTGESNSLNYTVDASANYQLERNNLSASFVRSTNSGSGVTVAARSNSANLSAGRNLTRSTRASIFVSYSSSTTLPNALLPAQPPFNSIVTGLQGSRSLTRSLSAYASYTLQRQSTGSANPSLYAVNALNGVTQSFGFGVTYSPRPIHLK